MANIWRWRSQSCCRTSPGLLGLAYTPVMQVIGPKSDWPGNLCGAVFHPPSRYGMVSVATLAPDTLMKPNVAGLITPTLTLLAGGTNCTWNLKFRSGSVRVG